MSATFGLLVLTLISGTRLSFQTHPMATYYGPNPWDILKTGNTKYSMPFLRLDSHQSSIHYKSNRMADGIRVNGDTLPQTNCDILNQGSPNNSPRILPLKSRYQ